MNETSSACITTYTTEIEGVGAKWMDGHDPRLSGQSISRLLAEMFYIYMLSSKGGNRRYEAKKYRRRGHSTMTRTDASCRVVTA